MVVFLGWLELRTGVDKMPPIRLLMLLLSPYAVAAVIEFDLFGYFGDYLLYIMGFLEMFQL